MEHQTTELGVLVSQKVIVGGALAASTSVSLQQVSWIQQHAAEIPLWCALAGVVVAFLGLVVSTGFQYARYRLDRLAIERRQKERRKNG